ncbi:ICE2 family protein [Eremomyces bilateralis CBS 781.70]|uniref:ICE2 family protein n=1 Tax=Eremomyces bilateralis CBS 781.70 TaxID=1392243 RepID=A0A6G1FZL1_9PEZI|nr:ICE2 family protein [Eremomyces bilateralis CBS 781.70]KAF1811121.1 ICE2 family protein [Eremomyces bilateralis CBS 781.70]
MPSIIRTFSSATTLFILLFTIPLTFDVGGRSCGLAFSLSLSVYYFFVSILRLSTPDSSRIRRTGIFFLQHTQWFVIAFLMLWTMNKFSVDAEAEGGGGWVTKAFGAKENPTMEDGLWNWVFGQGGVLEQWTIGGWDKFLRWSTPAFQLAEGFCSLLVIQVAGQITRWLVNRERGDSWMIGLLTVSASIFASSIYFLYRITTFPSISPTSAVLIGSIITCAIFLCIWGIASGRGNPVESSLLFAYITLCIYQIFTDFRGHSLASEVSQDPSSDPPALPPLPPIIMASYSTLLAALHSLPEILHTSFAFVHAALLTITPSVLVSLAFRVAVMSTAVRLVPVIRDGGARALGSELSLDDSDEAGRFLAGLSWFSPTILVAVYTSLLMQHFDRGTLEGTGMGVGAGVGNGAAWGGMWMWGGGNFWDFWRWINLVVTMALYAVEMQLGRDDGGLTTHWKDD